MTVRTSIPSNQTQPALSLLLVSVIMTRNKVSFLTPSKLNLNWPLFISLKEEKRIFRSNNIRFALRLKQASLFLSLSLSPFLSFSLSLSLSPFLSFSQSFFFSLSLSLSFSQSFFLSIFLSLSLPFFLSLNLSFSQSLFLSISLSLNLSQSLSLFLFF